MPDYEYDHKRYLANVDSENDEVANVWARWEAIPDRAWTLPTHSDFGNYLCAFSALLLLEGEEWRPREHYWEAMRLFFAPGKVHMALVERHNETPEQEHFHRLAGTRNEDLNVDLVANAIGQLVATKRLDQRLAPRWEWKAGPSLDEFAEKIGLADSEMWMGRARVVWMVIDSRPEAAK